MAGAGEEGGGFESPRETESSFEWDEVSNLYFHASTGFYHDPVGGWYYSSKDGLYYTFEHGSYVPLDCNKVSEAHHCTSSVQDNQCVTENVPSGGTGDQCPASEWLEETLINLYLSGYSSSVKSPQTEGEEIGHFSCEAMPDHLASHELPSYYNNSKFQQNDRDALISQNLQDAPELSGRSLGEETSWNEGNWRAQYGQVVQSGDEGLSSFPITELWDWEMVVETRKKNHQVHRLIGRLVRRSSKLHPSAPVGGGLLKTAAIHEVHLDLVRVASGKVYRLRSPSKRYLSSLSTYDSSDPTKGWGFPDLFINMQTTGSISSNQARGSDYSTAVSFDDSFTNHQIPSSSDKCKGPAYRDRAAERRSLHGCFSIAPEQKSVPNSKFDEAGSPSQISNTEEVAAESLSMSFGHGSFSRRILESMGWKEGEPLGSTGKGILEPLKAVGNKGYAGLGWNDPRRKPES